MKDNISALILTLLAILIIWLFPVIISFYTFNFWYIFLYLVWWIPAAFLTGILKGIYDAIK